MLRQAHGGIRRQRETGEAQPVDRGFLQAASFQQSGERARHEPVGAVDGIAYVRNRDRHRYYRILVASALGLHGHATGARFLRARVSTQADEFRNASASSFKAAR